MPKVTQCIGGILLGLSLGLNPLPSCNVSFAIIKVGGWIDRNASVDGGKHECRVTLHVGYCHLSVVDL